MSYTETIDKLEAEIREKDRLIHDFKMELFSNYSMALLQIASYQGFDDGAIHMSTIARTALKWEGYT